MSIVDDIPVLSLLISLSQTYQIVKIVSDSGTPRLTTYLGSDLDVFVITNI